MSSAVTETYQMLNELTRREHRGRGDTWSAARDRTARAAGVDRSYAKRIWDRWQTMQDVSGEAYRNIRAAYDRACEQIEASTGEMRAERLELRALRHADTEKRLSMAGREVGARD